MNHEFEGVEIPHGKEHFWGRDGPIEKDCNSQLRNNGWTLTFTQYIDRIPPQPKLKKYQIFYKLIKQNVYQATVTCLR